MTQIRQVTGVEMVDELSLRNRAYQVLYALGDTPGNVRTLTTGEAACLVGLVQDMLEADGEWNDLQVAIGSAMSMSMLTYVATGSMGAQPQIHAESASTPRA
jgi:hypothetical protein